MRRLTRQIPSHLDIGALMKNLFLGLVGCLALSGMAKGDVVYNNLNTSGSDYVSFDGSNSPTTGWRQWAQKFSLSSSTSTLDYIKLNIWQTSSSATSTFSVQIWSNNGTGATSTPNSVISTLVNNINTNTLGNTATSIWSLGGGINLGSTLNAGDYWVVVSSPLNDSGFRWSKGPSTPSYVTASNNSSLWDTPSNSYNLGGQIAVPEPGTLLLGGIAACSGAAGAWWKRRKRKATQPETTDQPATA